MSIMPVTGREQEQRTDADRIESIIVSVRTEHPSAVRFGVSSSDQGGGGYNVTDVTLVDGTVVDLSAELEDEMWEDAIWLRWGAFGDANMDSVFDVDMVTRRIVRTPFGVVD